MKIEINPQGSYLVKSTDGLCIRRYVVNNEVVVGVTRNPTIPMSAAVLEEVQ
jgi:hypothetical protein